MLVTMGGKNYTVIYLETVESVEYEILKDRPKWITFDSETTGIHIKKDRPFLWAVAWESKVFVFPSTEINVRKMIAWAKLTGMFVAHNCTFDMHMIANASDDRAVLEVTNFADTMGMCRLIFEAISKDQGGDSLALKDIGVKYIDPTANRYQKAVKAWLKAKVASDRKVLIAFLKPYGWGVKRFEEAMNKNVEPIPEEVMEVFRQWQNAYPEPTYQDVPLEIMLPYVAVDVILTDILVAKALPVVKHREQEGVMEKEFKLLKTVYKMERRGLPVDRKYLEESVFKLNNYIADLNIEMHEMAGREFSVGQHAVIKEIYTEKLGSVPESTDKQFLNKQVREGDELARIIRKLRTLEKWVETYGEKILKNASYDGRFYTSMGQFQPVTGRFSGDAQQFPKDPVYTLTGDEYRDRGEDVPEECILFQPRRAFIGKRFFLDYSQVELRYQAHHTLHFGGDVNLCRAYMPFKCVHSITGELYDFSTVEGRWKWIELREGAPSGQHWEDSLKDGWSIWIVPETGKPWVPTDVHGATSLRALRIMGFDPEKMSKKELKWWRNIGKRFNFMRNYGGGDKKAAETLEIDLDAAKAMNNGYTDAFPLVVTYQKAIERAMMKKGYVQSQSGRRYYLSESWRFYKCANYMIQGPCADILKDKMLLIDDYIDQNCPDLLGMVLCVHDELQFDCYGTKEEATPHIEAIKAIMEDTPQVLVPIVAEVEYTETNWAEKKSVA